MLVYQRVPLWKMMEWVRHLGLWLFPIYPNINGKIKTMFWTTNQFMIYRLIGIHHLLPSGIKKIIIYNLRKRKSADVFVPYVARSEQKWTYILWHMGVPCYPSLSCWFHHWLYFFHGSWIQWTDPDHHEKALQGSFEGSFEGHCCLGIWKWFLICFLKVLSILGLHFFAKTSDLLSTCFARSWIWDCFLPLISFNHPNPWRFYHIVYYMYIICIV